MLTYTTLKDRPREFLAATGLTHAEFVRVLPAFAVAYAALSPPDQTLQGKRRQRQVGGGAKGLLAQMEDKLRHFSRDGKSSEQFVWRNLVYRCVWVNKLSTGI